MNTPTPNPSNPIATSTLTEAIRLVEVMKEGHSRLLGKRLIDACSKALDATDGEPLKTAILTTKKALSLLVGQFAYHVKLANEIEVEQKGICLAEAITELKGKLASKITLLAEAKSTHAEVSDLTANL